MIGCEVRRRVQRVERRQDYNPPGQLAVRHAKARGATTYPLRGNRGAGTLTLWRGIAA